MAAEPETCYLDDVTYDDTVPFTLPVRRVKVVDVYDGDTITVACRLHDTDGAPVYRFKIRILNIDTPEIRTKDLAVKEMARAAKKTLEELILGKCVMIDEHMETDKYGRFLSNIQIGETDVAEHMLAGGFAVPYSGGTRIDWSAHLKVD